MPDSEDVTLKNRIMELPSNSQLPDFRRVNFSVTGFCQVLKSAAGFTLIELAVVLALIGMVLLLVVPKLPSTEQENLKVSARTLASTLRYMQERAATTRTDYYLSLAPGTDSAKIFETGGDGWSKEATDPLLQRAVLKEGVLIEDVVIPSLGKVKDGQLRLDVGMGGLRDFVIIHLRSPGGQFRTLMAFPAGGKVKVYEGYQEEPE